jgi:hypothetical protein
MEPSAIVAAVSFHALPAQQPEPLSSIGRPVDKAPTPQGKCITRAHRSMLALILPAGLGDTNHRDSLGRRRLAPAQRPAAPLAPNSRRPGPRLKRPPAAACVRLCARVLVS